MNNFPCFQKENESHLCQENGRNGNNKVLWIISAASSTKTTVTYVKNIGETLIEIAKCYEKLPLLLEQKQKSMMSRKWTKDGLKEQSVPINSPAFRMKTKVFFVNKIPEKSTEKANSYE